MSAKGNTQKQPKPAGLDELDVTTSQTDVPHPYFAGVRKLPVAWIMNPIISKVVAVSTKGKGK